MPENLRRVVPLSESGQFLRNLMITEHIVLCIIAFDWQTLHVHGCFLLTIWVIYCTDEMSKHTLINTDVSYGCI